MSRLPISIGSLAFVAVVVGSLVFIIDPAPITQGSASMVVAGVVGVALVGLAGLLLVRAPWTRWLLGVTILGSSLLASLNPTPMFWVSLALGGIALVGLAGPWLTLWVRQQPIADHLGHVPTALLASAGAAPIVVGLAAWSDASLIHWALVISVILSAWAYGRGLPFGIWGFRILVPLLGLLSGLGTRPLGGLVIIASTATIAALAWTPAAGKVTAVITPPLPAPIVRKGSADETE